MNSKYKAGLVIILTSLLIVGVVILKYFQTSDSIISVELVWADNKHNAFPSIVSFESDTFIAFRSALGHLKSKGEITVIKKNIFGEWAPVHKIVEPGYDLRDPKLSIRGDGKVLLIYGRHKWLDTKVVEKTVSRYVVISESINPFRRYQFSEPKNIILNNIDVGNKWWLWDLKWHKGYAYGFVYTHTPESNKISLVSSRNGIEFDLISVFSQKYKVNEASIDFWNDELRAVVRSNVNAFFIKSKAPYTDFEFKQLDIRVGGPNLINYNSIPVVLTRHYEKYKNKRTSLGFIVSGVDLEYQELIALPSYGDTGYGKIVLQNDKLRVVYYSSDVNQMNNISSNIYYTEISTSYIDGLIAKRNSFSSENQ